MRDGDHRTKRRPSKNDDFRQSHGPQGRPKDSKSEKMKIAMTIKNSVRSLLPLKVRQHLAVILNKQTWLGANHRSWWCQEMIRDMTDNNINEYHKFLWSNHLSYASTYEIASRFGDENMKQSRKLFFTDLQRHLATVHVNAERDIRSVFEAGCSLGYQLRHMETKVFPGASRFDGIDIDAHAIASGTEYLRSIGSKARLYCGDMEELGRYLDEKRYDVVICCGVLMYLDEDAAIRLVSMLLKRTNTMLAFSGLAHPAIDNALLRESVPRSNDKSFIHNIDAMITRSGGRVVFRRWEGANLVDGHTIYFVFGAPRRQ